MELSEIVRDVPDFAGRSHLDKIKFFAWWLHIHKGRERFDQEMIRTCYDTLHYAKPGNVSPYLLQLKERKPPDIIKDSRGYYLEGRIRTQFDGKYGQRSITIQVDKILADLSGKISNEAERLFYTEAIVCFRNGAFRAAIVMTWNLSYDHLEEYILTKHLAAFNARIHIRYPSKRLGLAVNKKDDFADFFKESEVIEICNSANIIPGNVKKILDEMLVRRNMAAHPSLVEITQLQAEHSISDLINNVVLKLA